MRNTFSLTFNFDYVMLLFLIKTKTIKNGFVSWNKAEIRYKY